MTTVLHTIIVSLIIVISAPILFNATLPANGLSFVLSFILMAFACMGLGLLIGVVAPNSRVTIMLGQVVFLPSMLIGGMMIPAYSLPETLRKIALLLPSNHAMNLINGWVANGNLTFNAYGSVLVLFAGGALALGMALYLFNWDGQNRNSRNTKLALVALLPYVIAVIVSMF